MLQSRVLSIYFPKGQPLHGNDSGMWLGNFSLFQTGMTDWLLWNTKEKFIKIASCSLQLQCGLKLTTFKQIQKHHKSIMNVIQVQILAIFKSPASVSQWLVLWTGSVLRSSNSKEWFVHELDTAFIILICALASFLIL